MTKSEIISATRNLVNELSTDSGALLSDTGNLLEYVNDAMEHVVLDLVDIMPDQFLTSETVTLIANQANYTLTASFWQIYKVEKNVTGEAPREIPIINQLDKTYWMNVGDTESEPTACYFIGDTLYFIKTPSAAATDYAKVWLIRPEAATMATAGPSYIPAPAHRLIVYRAAELVATMLECSPTLFIKLYDQRLEKVRRTWAARYRSQPRFVQGSIEERMARSSRDSTLFDTDWE